MTEIINLSGRWSFQEDFGFGKDTGYAVLSQDGKYLDGYMQFSEQIEGEETFIVKQIVTGKIEGNQVFIDANAYEILFNDEDIVYELDSWEGTITPEGQIVGSSMDDEGTTGVFVMKREPVKTPNSTSNY